MLIKEADGRAADQETLTLLRQRFDVPDSVRKEIDREMRMIQAGLRAERDAAYEIEFHYAQSSNWASIHDLRLECDGRVAQIDHLLINRFLDIYVCESKSFGEGVAINDMAEFSAFFGGRPYGVPSPLEQNRRHIAVLQSVFKTGRVSLPRRLGFPILPTFHNLVLVSKSARITRPRKKIDGIDSIIKNDQLNAKINKNIDNDNNPLMMAKLVGQETLRELAERLAAEHRPIRVNWPGKFGLPLVAPPPTSGPAASRPEQIDSRNNLAKAETPPAQEPVKNKLMCVACASPVSYAVAKFCWVNKSRFNGQVYCMDCQHQFARLS